MATYHPMGTAYIYARPADVRRDGDLVRALLAFNLVSSTDDCTALGFQERLR